MAKFPVADEGENTSIPNAFHEHYEVPIPAIFYQGFSPDLAFLILSSCTGTGSNPFIEDNSQIRTQNEVVEYFKEIALGFEFGGAAEVNRKWNTDVKIFVGGENEEQMLDELNNIISELNELISGDDIEMSITSDSSASNF